MDLDTVDVNNVFEDQQLVGAGDFTLDGAGVTSGVWTSGDGFAKIISFESSANLSAVTLTITGFSDINKNHAITEDLLAPNATTTESTKYFAVITQIAADGAIGTNIESGFSDEAVSQIVALNWRASPFVVGIGAVVTGTINYTLQHSFDDPQLGAEAMTWFDYDISDMASATATADGNYSASVLATRQKVNSYSAGAALKTTWIQGQGGN
tara:strand:- start:2826 stop:3458 length:633 start_codon:yes stop_codon:yes gene_type:complete